jgi:hypothetical protein
MADLSNLSDEEILALLEKASATKGGDPNLQKHETVKAQLPDGTVLEADTAEELNRLLVAKLGEYREADEPEPIQQQQQVPQIPQELKFGPAEQKKFAELFVQDAAAGMEFLETKKYGMPVSKLVPLLVMGLGQMTTKIQELEAESFVNGTEGYNPSVENRKTIEKVMAERNWKPSRQTFSDAFDIARAKGLINVEKASSAANNTANLRSETKTFIPPRTPKQSSSDQQLTETELLNKASNMKLEDLENLLFEGGVLKVKHT